MGKKIHRPKNRVCRNCKGTRVKNGNRCSACEGKGFINISTI